MCSGVQQRFFAVCKKINVARYAFAGLLSKNCGRNDFFFAASLNTAYFLKKKKKRGTGELLRQFFFVRFPGRNFLSDDQQDSDEECHGDQQSDPDVDTETNDDVADNDHGCNG